MAGLRQALAVSLVMLVFGLAGKGKMSLIDLVDVTTQARDLCDNVRSKLVTLDTKHFSDQAAQVWYAVDRYKSGLNALLNYFDTNAPTKVIEARDKFREGDANLAAGIKAINIRRHLYGLPPLTP